MSFLLFYNKIWLFEKMKKINYLYVNIILKFSIRFYFMYDKII